MSNPCHYTWSASLPCSPVLLQRVVSPSDVREDCIKPSIPQPTGGVLTGLDQVNPDLTHRVSGRHRTRRLLFLMRQRHLLTLTQDFVVHQINVLKFHNVCGMFKQRPPRSSELATVCENLLDVCRKSVFLQKRLRGDKWLYPISPSLQETITNMQQVLVLLTMKAIIVTEKLILSVLRRVANFPAEVTRDLSSSLTMYNQALSDMSKWLGSWSVVQPFTVGRMLEMIAEERGCSLAGLFCRMLVHCGLEETLKREMYSRKWRKVDGNPLFSGQHPAIDLLQRVSEPRSNANLEALIQLDRHQVSPVLQILDSFDQNMWNLVSSSSESALYNQYCTHLWPVLYAHIFQAFYPGIRKQQALPALSSCAEGAHVSAVQFLSNILASDNLPGQCQSLGLRLCDLLLCTGVFIAWDHVFCQALSSALTDKCVVPVSYNGDRSSDAHSRTSGILVNLCRQLSGLLHSMSSSHPGQTPHIGSVLPDPPHVSDPRLPYLGSVLSVVSIQHGVLTRCAASLQVCDLWIRSGTQTYVSSGSLSHLVLVTYGDVPVIKEGSRTMATAAGTVRWLPPSQRLCVKMQNAQEVLDGLTLSVTYILGSVCARKARDVFQHVMPAGRHWRGKLVAGPELAPSDYARVAVSAVVLPVLDGVLALSLDGQVTAVPMALSAFMETWMGHILRQRLKFSLQGALQLRCDFESVREVLRSQESRMSPEVVQAALSLPVFLQADNAIVCLLQQPSHKTYLQARGCPIFCCPFLCRAAVESVSDSLQSLDSLERRAWARTYSTHRHSHDSYLPHNQRQWLSLRVHKNFNGMNLSWEGRETSEE